MRKSKYSDSQIMAILKQNEQGVAKARMAASWTPPPSPSSNRLVAHTYASPMVLRIT